MPKMPMATGRKSMPSSSSGLPKVSRATAEDRIGADQREHQAEDGGQQRLDRRACAHAGGRGDAERGEQEIFGRGELQRERG